jgi:flagellar basal body rod protein FlgG
MIANGDESPSCVEMAQDLYDALKEKEYSEEILNNAMQLMKKIQNQSLELSNVDHVEEAEEEVEEDDSEDSVPDYEKMSKDEMGQDLKKKGIISVSIGIVPKAEKK